MTARSLVPAFAAAALLSGCHCRSGDDPQPSALDAFEAWREVQQSLRASPDHLPGRAEALVAAGDVDGLFALVRDDIALVPGQSGFFSSAWAERWGTRATLRGGMGTMRERADLLAELVRATGAEAEVWEGEPEAGFDVQAALAHAPNRAVRYAATAEQRAQWDEALPATTAGWSFSPLDSSGAVAAAVVDGVHAAGIDGSSAIGFDWDVGRIPFVRATVAGVTVDLNPNVPGAARGEARVEAPYPSGESGGMASFTVQLEVEREGSFERTLLVERTWTADEIVGRTVTAAFSTPYSFLEAAVTPAQDAWTFVPYLAVDGAGLGDEEAQALSAVGDPITRGGAVLALGDDGSLLIDGQHVAAPPSDPARLDAVAAVQIDVDEAAFPEIHVAVSCEDAGGALVEDLAADAFRVLEDGVEQRAVLQRSRAPAPAVLLLFDRSSSLPAEFLAEAATTGHTIAAAVFDAVPGALIQVAGMDFGRPAGSGLFVSTLEEVDAQLADLGGAASEVWHNLDVAADSGASVIVLISDFVAEDAETEDFAQNIAAGPPVLAVAVGDADGEAADRVVALTDGQRIDGTDAAAVAAGTAAFVAARDAYSYVLAYVASTSGKAQRAVTVTVDADRLDAADVYLPPALPAPTPAIAHLYLTVLANGRSVTRTLPPELLFGRAVVMVEAGPPSLSVKLDEHIGERFAYEPVFAAILAGDEPEAWRTLQSSRGRTPVGLRFAFSSSARELAGPATFPDGLSAAIAVDRPEWGVGIHHSLDWLAVVSRRTPLADPVAGFEETLGRTAYLAAIEQARYDTSTAGLLEGEALGSFPAGSVDFELGPEWYTPALPYFQRELAAPLDGDPIAFWAVDPFTGDVIGGLSDGTGGATQVEVEATLQQIEVILSLAERAGALVEFNGISVWVQLERTKAQLVGAATILIGDGIQPDFESIFEDAVTGAINDEVTGEIPGWDEAVAPAGDLGDLYDIVEAGTGREMPDIPDIELIGR